MIIAILIVGNFLALINETVMNVALPKIIEDFGVSANTAQWLSTGYMLMIGIAVPHTAFLMQRFTTRQLFLSAMSLFTLGTFLASVAPAFPLVLAGRIIQGSGTGLILPLVMNVILTLVPPHKRGTMTGMLTLVILFAPADRPCHLRLYCRTLFMADRLFHDAARLALHDLLCSIPIKKCNRIDPSEN